MAIRPKSVIESHDGEKLSPITITKNVLKDNGQNLHDILSDRKEDMMTPTIENSSSMFKVGQGDNVDYSENVVNGAYESCVLKGKSLVNLLTKTIDTTWNLNLENWSFMSTAPSDCMLKPSTTYSVIVYVTEKTCPDREDLFWVGDVDGKKDKVTHDIVRKNVSLGANVFVINTVSDFSSITSEYRGGINFQGSKFVEGTLKWKAIVLEGDWTNKELPPYFEGICDCKSPILSNVGKNLFNINGKFIKSGYSNGIPIVSHPNNQQTIEKIGDNTFRVITSPNGYNTGYGQFINVRGLDHITLSCSSIFSNSNTFTEIKVLCMYQGEELLTTVNYETSKNYINRVATLSLSTPNQEYSTNIYVAPYDRIFVSFTGNWKSEMSGTFEFTMNDVYIRELLNNNEDYEPYKSNTTTFSTDDDKTIVLRSSPNGVCDTLNIETGKYTQNVIDIVLDGTENWILNNWGTDDNYCSFEISSLNNSKIQNVYKQNSYINFYCDTFKVLTNCAWNYMGEKHIRQWSDGNRTTISVIIPKTELKTYDVAGFIDYLTKNNIRINIRANNPIVTTIDIQGFPYAYTNGHVQLSSGSIEQSLTPTVEYSVVTNRNGQIRSNQKMVERQQKQLNRLQAMVLANLVNTQYEQTLTNLKYDLKNVREEVK